MLVMGSGGTGLGGMVGWAKFRLQRAGTYVGLMNFGMILYNTALNEPLGLSFWNVVFVGVVALIVVTVADKYWIYPNEVKASVRENPWMNGVSEDVKACRKILEKYKFYDGG